MNKTWHTVFYVLFFGAVLDFELMTSCYVLWTTPLNELPKMANGTVKWFNATKGFGFIAPENGNNDIFLHISAVERAGLREVKDGQAVTFDVERGRDGRESATNLQLA